MIVGDNQIMVLFLDNGHMFSYSISSVENKFWHNKKKKYGDAFERNQTHQN